MLKHHDVNPLNVHQLRRMDHCPPHFTPVTFNLSTSEKAITDWVWENLQGRFFFGDRYSTKEDGTLDLGKTVAFEQPGEASYFALMLSSINQYNHQ